MEEPARGGQTEGRQRLTRFLGRDASRGEADTWNAADNIYSSAGARALLSMKRKRAHVSAGCTGSLVVGVDPS